MRPEMTAPVEPFNSPDAIRQIIIPLFIILYIKILVNTSIEILTYVNPTHFLLHSPAPSSVVPSPIEKHYHKTKPYINPSKQV